MNNKNKGMTFFSTAVLCVSFMGCENPEQQKVNFLAEGKHYLEIGEYAKASLAFKNLQQIEPKDLESHFLLGEAYFKQGNINGAYNEYSLVINQDDSNITARIRLGQLLLRNQNFQRAEIIAQSVLASQPNNFEALVLAAGVKLSQKDYEKALPLVEQAKQIKPGDLSVVLLEAGIYSETQRLDQAIQLLSAAEEKNQSNSRILILLAEFYARKHQLAEAEFALRKVIKISPKDADVYMRLAHYQYAEKQKDKAEATLREAVESLPDSPLAKNNLIDFLAGVRGLDVAIAELNGMISKSEQNPELRFRLASMQLAKNDLQTAEQLFKEVIKLDSSGPFGIKARNELEVIYYAGSRRDEAKVLIKEVLDINSRDSGSLTIRGELARDENKLADAISDFRNVLANQPDNAMVLKMLAGVYLLVNDPVSAKELLEKVIGLQPNDELARLDLASVLFKEGSKAQARQQIEIYLQAHPGSIRAYESLFRFALLDNDAEQSQEIAKQVQKQFSKEGLGWYMAGLSYQSGKKTDLAIQAFQEALLKNPDAVEPLVELIQSYRTLKQPDKALEKLHQLISQQPRNIMVYVLMGNLLIDEKKLSEARTAFQKVQEMKPDWFAGYLGIAAIELLQKNELGAINILEIGLEKTKDALELGNELVGIYQKQGQFNKILAIYEKSYKNHPHSMEAVNNLAAYLAEYSTEQEDINRAAKIAESLQIINNPVYMETLAWISYRQGDYNKAKDIMLKLVDQKLITAKGQYHLGMIFYKLKETSMATVYLQKAVNANVAFYDVREANDTLKKIQENNF
jgi:tetratricopeptide (TPR) repeat protein